jgi:ferredoxin-thioredoxin reductase catalytic subunit
MVWKGI